MNIESLDSLNDRMAQELSGVYGGLGAGARVYSSGPCLWGEVTERQSDGLVRRTFVLEPEGMEIVLYCDDGINAIPGIRSAELLRATAFKFASSWSFMKRSLSSCMVSGEVSWGEGDLVIRTVLCLIFGDGVFEVVWVMPVNLFLAENSAR